MAGTRPRIRRDVLYTRTPTGVHFHNARGGFSVVMPSAYRFASLIVPHLTGDHTVAELCVGLGDKQRAMVARLVSTLYARGFARDALPPAPGSEVPEPAVAERFAAQIAYVDHYADDAAARFLRFRTARVAVLGEDRLARWAALSLIRNGSAAVAVPAGIDVPANRFAEVADEARALREQDCPVDLDLLAPPPAPGGYGWADLGGYDVVLVTGEHAAAQTAALAPDVPAGRMLVPAWTFGGSVVVGPLMRSGTTGCWTCAALRLGANGDPAHAADLWRDLATGGSDGASGGAVGRNRALSGPLAAMVGNLLGYEVFRLTTGALTPETEGQVVVQEIDSLDTVVEPLLPHPRCPHCAPRAAPEAPAPAVIPLAALSTEQPAVEASEAEEDLAQAALAEITDRSVLVQPTAGVFQRFADEAWAQTPLKVSTVEVSTGHGAPRAITAFDVHHVAGARLRALHRAAEVYAEHVVPLPQPLTGAVLTGARDHRPAVDPAALSTSSGTGEQDLPTWSTATSLLDGRTVLVPAAALRPFGPDNHQRAVEPTAAGLGAGGTPAEATERAVLTALAHDTLRGALHGRVRVAAVDPAGVEAAGDPELTFLVRSAAGLGVPLEILDLGTDEQRVLPVVLARAAGPDTGGPAAGAPRWAVAAGPSWRDAALEAVRDLLGACQFAADPQSPAAPDLGDPLLKDFEPATLVPQATLSAADLLPEPLPGAAVPATGPVRRPTDVWPAVADRLRAAGRDLLAAPIPAPDLAAGRLYVTRVLLTEDGTPNAH
ncbi:TOMM precursor leader peptide-binding protein [Streptomyces sp. KK5PA1]|uniref:TOMM leader peptide-binding protein n=1 Tax=Actinacidiphila acididurans TaxID=2784346 RepID=A0ABS2TUG7_9ACTN|nr:TOMM precursor leader peptide-binding protein [Actinacidiphila acididurans]